MQNINILKFWGIVALAATAIFALIRFPITLGLDLQGGTRLVLEAQGTKEIKISESLVEGVKQVIENRINSWGIKETTVQRKGRNQIIIELPGVKNPERAIRLIGDTALLEFIEAEWAPGDESVLTKEKIKEIYGRFARLGHSKITKDGQVVSKRPIILKKTVLTGKDLKNTDPGMDQYGNPVVNIEFKSQGAKIFGQVTTRSVGKPLAIVLDGTIISSPNVREPIAGGRAQISGDFTIEEVKDLVAKLRGGSLPVPVKIIENKIVGPTLGKDSIDKSKVAGIIGFAAIFIFMIGFYRYQGFLANIALCIYMVLVAATLTLFRTTLTLPGIAGFLLSIGMAVDANIIIFERLKEEMREGKSGKLSIELSFKRALSAILDANVTTLLAAFVLIFLSTGPIRGFAIVLSIGIAISMFTAIIVTRLFLDMSQEAGVINAKSKIIYK